jgi:hypothetical protein
MYSAILLAGYNNKKAVEKYKHIVEEDYGEHFIETGYKPLHEFSVVYTNPRKDHLGRPPLLLVNDTEVEIPEEKDKHGRNGFRLSSLMMGNPYELDVNMINVMYSVRKALNPKTQLRIFRICREVGFPRLYNRYFIKKNLSITQCEKICSAFFKGDFKAVLMHDIKSTYDFDGTEKEFLEINKMLEE